MTHYNVRHLSDTDTIPVWKAEIREKERVKEVLAEIRQEIAELKKTWEPTGNSISNAGWVAYGKCLAIIDKHMKGGDIDA